MLLLATLLVGLAPVQVTPPEFERAKEPQLAIDGSDVYVAYGMGETIYVSRSADEGKSYASPVKVADLKGLALGMRRGPRVAAHQGRLTVTAISHSSGNLLAYRSTDKGKSWSPPVVVNTVDRSAHEGLHGMAASAQGVIACVWLDLRAKGTQLYSSVSTDGGATWSDNRLVYASPSGTICECCHPSAAFDPRGTLYVMFRNSLEGARDMYLSRSSDLRTFSPAAKLGQGTWTLKACPMDGGMLAIDASGAVHSVWRREARIYLSGEKGADTPLETAVQPWIAARSEGPVMVWQRSREIVLSAGAGPVVVSSTGSSPVVATDVSGRLAIAAWTEGGIRALRVAP